MTEEPFHAFSFDGVLGLGLDSLALAPEFSFFGMMAKQVALEHRSFGVFLADTDAEVSEISFGGSSEDKVASPMTWAPVALPDLGYWQVEIKAIRIGDRTLDYCADGQCRAVVDTGTSLLAVPEDFAEGLQEVCVIPPLRGCEPEPP
ncbi:Ctse [Symbiodinium pilosum]|uniref:Ctse protein n=1 Tax=Symbiodinium pilosum TaxID=2952 RepID=A0A812ITD9_SYMPI|nr:Ctse [Symbiodinium pilosum]